MAISFQKLLPNRVFNCPLLPTSKNSLAGELPTTQKFLDTPLVSYVEKDVFLILLRNLCMKFFQSCIILWYVRFSTRHSHDLIRHTLGGEYWLKKLESAANFFVPFFTTHWDPSHGISLKRKVI